MKESTKKSRISLRACNLWADKLANQTVMRSKQCVQFVGRLSFAIMAPPEYSEAWTIRPEYSGNTRAEKI